MTPWVPLQLGFPPWSLIGPPDFRNAFYVTFPDSNVQTRGEGIIQVKLWSGTEKQRG